MAAVQYLVTDPVELLPLLLLPLCVSLWYLRATEKQREEKRFLFGAAGESRTETHESQQDEMGQQIQLKEKREGVEKGLPLSAATGSKRSRCLARRKTS